MLMKFTNENLKIRIHRTNLVKEDAPAELIERRGHSALILKSAFFLLVAFPQAVKLLSMRGIPLIQCCAVILLSAAVINPVCSLSYRHTSSEFRVIVLRSCKDNWRTKLRVFAFVSHFALYAGLWVPIARNLTLLDTSPVHEAVLICNWIGNILQFLLLVSALPWILGPLFSDRVDNIQPWTIRGYWILLLATLFTVPKYILVTEACDCLKSNLPPYVFLLRWTFLPVIGAAIVYLVSRLLLACASRIPRESIPQASSIPVKTAEQCSQAQSLLENGKEQNEATVEAQPTPRIFPNDVLAVPLRDVSENTDDDREFGKELDELLEYTSDLERIQKLAQHVKKHAFNPRLLLPRSIFPPDSDSSPETLIARALRYTLQCGICIVQAPVFVCGYILATLCLYLNGLPVLVKPLRFIVSMDRNVFWVAFAVFNFLTALMYFTVAFDGAGTANSAF